MSNWYIDYKIKYFLRFRHDDGRTEVHRNIIIIEARSEDEARKKSYINMNMAIMR